MLHNNPSVYAGRRAHLSVPSPEATEGGEAFFFPLSPLAPNLCSVVGPGVNSMAHMSLGCMVVVMGAKGEDRREGRGIVSSSAFGEKKNKEKAATRKGVIIERAMPTWERPCLLSSRAPHDVRTRFYEPSGCTALLRWHTKRVWDGGRLFFPCFLDFSLQFIFCQVKSSHVTWKRRMERVKVVLTRTARRGWASFGPPMRLCTAWVLGRLVSDIGFTYFA